MDEVHIVDYDAGWPEKFATEAAHVREVFGGPNLIAIEHIGSTAVPGLAAKPIIDLLVTVRSLAEVKKSEPIIEAMQTRGYAYWYDNPRQDRMFFVQGLPPNGPRTHHVHVTQAGGELAEHALLFRDYLRAHPEDREAYAALKRELAAHHQQDREAYTDAKSKFVHAVVAKARTEPKEQQSAG